MLLFVLVQTSPMLGRQVRAWGCSLALGARVPIVVSKLVFSLVDGELNGPDFVLEWIISSHTVGGHLVH